MRNWSVLAKLSLPQIALQENLASKDTVACPIKHSLSENNTLYRQIQDQVLLHRTTDALKYNIAEAPQRKGICFLCDRHEIN